MTNEQKQIIIDFIDAVDAIGAWGSVEKILIEKGHKDPESKVEEATTTLSEM